MSNHSAPSIQALDPKTSSLIKSSLSIPSLKNLLESLLQISLKSKPTLISCSLNTSSNYLRIDDDGIGFNKPSIYEILSNNEIPNSKIVNDDDLGYRLEGSELHLFRSLVCLASVEICSRTEDSDETYQIIFQDGIRVFSGPAKTSRRHKTGSTLTIRNLFHNLPVRSKQLIINHQQDFLECKRSLQLLAILHPNVNFNLHNLEHSSTGQSDGLVEHEFKESGVLIQKTHDSIITFGKILGQALIKDAYIIENYEFDNFIVEGFLGKETHLNKSGQLIFLDGKLIPSTSLIYQRLSKSMSFSNNLGNPASSHKSMKKSSSSFRRFERYPIWLLILISKDQLMGSHLGLLYTDLSSRTEERLSKLGEKLCQVFIDRKDEISNSGLPEDSNRISQRTFEDPVRERLCFGRDGNESTRKRLGSEKGSSSNKKSRSLTSELFTKSDQDTRRSPLTFEKGLMDRFKYSKKQSILDHQKEDLSTKNETRIEYPRVSVKRIGSNDKENREEEEGSRRPEWITRSLSDYRNPVFGRKEGSTKRIFKAEEIKTLQTNTNSKEDERNSSLKKESSKISFKEMNETRQDCKTIIDLKWLKDSKRFKLVGQADRKLIVVYFNEIQTIVVFDQHAVDERIRVERFLKQIILPELLVMKKIDKKGQEEIEGVRLGVSEVELEGFKRWKIRFRRYGFDYEIRRKEKEDEKEVWVIGLAEVVFKRLKKDGFFGLGEVMRMCLSFFESHQEEKEMKNKREKDWMNGMKFLPGVLIEIINSKACRGSIMFGDQLNHEECSRLLNGLCRTDEPFYCAHGRMNCRPILNFMNPKEIQKKKEIQEKKEVAEEEEDQDEYFHEFLFDRFSFGLGLDLFMMNSF